MGEGENAAAKADEAVDPGEGSPESKSNGRGEEEVDPPRWRDRSFKIMRECDSLLPLSIILRRPTAGRRLFHDVSPRVIQRFPFCPSHSGPFVISLLR